ncbi:hypothetical protein P154DRAFT_575139 [Amniculicola lignicola CBS 123094]|uniref:Uncharacterized protein n=1 Tax=Amniculicola lignicola CBS 123094 TaxID=1392246 RepID=A0A6A5WIZ8_9PLEO|nr:hypothetical protein P154DRAFT_575139 [Amniculicola lignicola CBS 123094]
MRKLKLGRAGADHCRRTWLRAERGSFKTTAAKTDRAWPRFRRAAERQRSRRCALRGGGCRRAHRAWTAVWAREGDDVLCDVQSSPGLEPKRPVLAIGARSQWSLLGHLDLHTPHTPPRTARRSHTGHTSPLARAPAAHARRCVSSPNVHEHACCPPGSMKPS